jgi:hypothetical protein
VGVVGRDILRKAVIAIVVLNLLSLNGCRRPGSSFEVTEATYEPKTGFEELLIGISISDTGGGHYLSDINGIKVVSLTDFFPYYQADGKFGESVISWQHSLLNYNGIGYVVSVYNNSLGKMRELVIKNTHWEYPEYLVDETGRYIVIGCIGSWGVMDPLFGIWIIDCASSQDRVIVLPELPDDERTENIRPLLIDDDRIHFLVTSYSSRQYYFVCDFEGITKHVFRLPESAYGYEAKVIKLYGPGEQRYLLGTSSGFVAVSPENEGAILTELSTTSYTVGAVGGDTPYVVWMSFNEEDDYTQVWRHDLASGENTPVFWIGKNLGRRIELNSAFLEDQHALLLEIDGDIWRYDMRVGHAGKMWDTPDVNESLEWIEEDGFVARL